MISWQWWWKGPFKLITSRLSIKHFDWIQNILIVYTLMSKNDLRQAVDTRQLAKENTFNTSFSSNADRQTPLQVHIIQIHSMISQFCAFEAGMQPSKRFLCDATCCFFNWFWKSASAVTEIKIWQKINKRIAVPLLKFPRLLITTELELWSPEQLWGMKLDISYNTKYFLQYKIYPAI